MPKSKTIYHQDEDGQNSVYMYYNDKWNIKLFINAKNTEQCIRMLSRDYGDYGWLGSKRFLRIGIPDSFSDIVGSQDFLRRHYGLDRISIVENIQKHLELS